MSGSSSAEESPEIVDADPQIVLSDLVAHGEASRLRRRGALHVRHRSDASSVSSGPTRWGRSMHDLALGHDDRIEEEDEAPTYALFCGRDDEEAEEEEEQDGHLEPSEWKPAILPVYPPQATMTNTKSAKPKTGCGSLLHPAVRLTQAQQWVSAHPPTSAVVPLPSMYLDNSEHLMTYGAQAVACAIWCVLSLSS